ncbi:hypothetical protein QTO34_012632 [Cnephaeus nilssonii]|uniref:Ig-like domain-containing protein n=1 Tax=Cnephaeus nilssonii TaxID=3371016 RepID=A0AA40HAL0_CNENI|nr:hypothetical protein QTO34_012632 [Eptesicus nilssonii]
MKRRPSSWSREGTSRTGPGPLSVVVGGTVRAALGANVTIQCPVRGTRPPAHCELGEERRAAGGQPLVFPNGSLLLQNVSRQNKGTYVCRATSALGKAVATSVLHPLGKCPLPGWALWASPPTGHPVWDSWVGGTLAGPCRLASPLILPPTEPAWRPGNWTPCPATCGRSGARVRRLRCVAAGGQDVSEALCGHLRRPQARPLPALSRRDLPPGRPPSPIRGPVPAELLEFPPAGGLQPVVRVLRLRREGVPRSAGDVSTHQGQRHGVGDARGGLRPRRPASGEETVFRPPGKASPPLFPRPGGQRSKVKVSSGCSGTTPFWPGDSCSSSLPCALFQCPGRCLGRAVRIQPRPVLCPHNSSDPRCEDSRY